MCGRVGVARLGRGGFLSALRIVPCALIVGLAGLWCCSRCWAAQPSVARTTAKPFLAGWSSGRRSRPTRCSRGRGTMPGTARSASAAISWWKTGRITSGTPAITRTAPGRCPSATQPRPTACAGPATRRTRSFTSRGSKMSASSARTAGSSCSPRGRETSRTSSPRPTASTGTTWGRSTSVRPPAPRSAPALTARRPPGSRTERGTSFTSGATWGSGSPPRRTAASGPTSRTPPSWRWGPSPMTATPSP